MQHSTHIIVQDRQEPRARRSGGVLRAQAAVALALLGFRGHHLERVGRGLRQHATTPATFCEGGFVRTATAATLHCERPARPCEPRKSGPDNVCVDNDCALQCTRPSTAPRSGRTARRRRTTDGNRGRRLHSRTARRPSAPSARSADGLRDPFCVPRRHALRPDVTRLQDVRRCPVQGPHLPHHRQRRRRRLLHAPGLPARRRLPRRLLVRDGARPARHLRQARARTRHDLRHAPPKPDCVRPVRGRRDAPRHDLRRGPVLHGAQRVPPPPAVRPLRERPRLLPRRRPALHHVGSEKAAPPTARTDADCESGFQCTSGACVPRFGTCAPASARAEVLRAVPQRRRLRPRACSCGCCQPRRRRAPASTPARRHPAPPTSTAPSRPPACTASASTSGSGLGRATPSYHTCYLAAFNTAVGPLQLLARRTRAPAASRRRLLQQELPSASRPSGATRSQGACNRCRRRDVAAAPVDGPRRRL